MGTAHTGYNRRKSTPVTIGKTIIGDGHPIAVQSMTNTPTMDTESSAKQIMRIADAGADIVRLTAQTPAHAANLGAIRNAIHNCGYDIPLVADIHFNPAAAFTAAEQVEKVRINPGNFADPGRSFKKIEFTDEEYAAELQRIRDKFIPFLNLCKEHGTAIRLGVNHGSLSDRIMSRYGDTPAGMVESVMEYLRICVAEGFTDVVISIKASNVVVMTDTVRLLVDAMNSENMQFPLHLGVTEAGDGEDARIKSAVGIGSLLADGIGDTIRVSLSEAPEHEIPVARMILDHIETLKNQEHGISDVVITPPASLPLVPGYDEPQLLDGIQTIDTSYPEVIYSGIRQMAMTANGLRVGIKAHYPADMTADEVLIAAAIDLGYLLLKFPLSAISIEAPALTSDEATDLALGILQATRRRMTKTEYIACPSCGRTLFDLESTLAQVKAATAHLKSLKIGVMGCIVNGPGEMADADYGYVGAGPGKVSIYRGKECVIKNIPTEEALPRLLEIIKSDGRLTDETPQP